MQQADVILSQLFNEHGRQASYGSGDMIIRAGDTPSGVYAITEGWIKVYSLCESGEQNIIMSLGPYDIFPLEWAVSGVLRDVSFSTLEATSVLRVSREQFLQSLRSSPQTSEAALSKLTQYFCRLSGELENLAYRSARERVAFRLVSLAEGFGLADAEQVIFEPRIPNEYIARSCNMTRETASREISWLAKKGIINHQNGHIIINNLPALKKKIGKSFQVLS